MGGTGSGRHYRFYKKPTLEGFKSLDINQMVKLGAICDGVIKKGCWQWADADTQEVISSIGYECNTLDESLSLRLYYDVSQTGKSFNYQVSLSKTPINFGGHRFWFHCPETNARVSKLYLVPDDGRFLSRHASKTPYASQMEGDLDRALSMRDKVASKLSDPYCLKPKGMHQKTFEGLLMQYNKYHKKCLKIMEERLKPYTDKYTSMN